MRYRQVKLDAGSVDPDLLDLIGQAQTIVRQAAPGLSLVVVSGYRSTQDQRLLRDRFLRGDRGGLAAEPARHSRHAMGRAVDLQFAFNGALVPVRHTPRSYWLFLARLLAPVGVRWGGRFRKPDPNHFEI